MISYEIKTLRQDAQRAEMKLAAGSTVPAGARNTYVIRKDVEDGITKGQTQDK